LERREIVRDHRGENGRDELREDGRRKHANNRDEARLIVHGDHILKIQRANKE